MFVIHTEHAVPSKLADYEATTKEFISLVQANRSAMPGFAFTVLQGEDLSYNFVTPIRSFADADGIMASFDALAKAVGAEKFGDYMRRSGADLHRARRATPSSRCPAAPTGRPARR